MTLRIHRLPLAGLLLCLMSFGAVHPGSAKVDRESGGEPLARMEGEGWKVVRDGVLQRQPSPGEVETFVFGVDGFIWKLRDLRGQLQALRREFEANPTPELRRAIASHRKAIASTLETIDRAKTAAGTGGNFSTTDGGCNLSFSYDADAAHKVNVRGTWAAASAHFKTASESCGDSGEASGEVYAYAFAKATVNGAPTTATVTDGPRTGANVSASADANRNGGPTCESYAYSSVTSNALYPTSYSRSKTNESCPAASAPSTLQVSVASNYQGQSEVVIWEERCVTVDWTVNVAGGTPPYTVGIYRNGVFQKNGTSYSEQFCFDQEYEAHYVQYVNVTLSANVTDSAGQSQSASDTVTLHYRWLIY